MSDCMHSSFHINRTLSVSSTELDRRINNYGFTWLKVLTGKMAGELKNKFGRMLSLED